MAKLQISVALISGVALISSVWRYHLEPEPDKGDIYSLNKHVSCRGAFTLYLEYVSISQ